MNFTGRKHTEEEKIKISLSMKGIKKSDIHKLNISKGKTGKPNPKLSLHKKGKLVQNMKGSSHYLWKHDRSQLAKRQERNDTAYKEWRMSVWKRDNFKCRISNQECNGKIECHHILGWSDYPGLRYEINNGITLCHAHHPRRRAEETKLVPVFQDIISVIAN